MEMTDDQRADAVSSERHPGEAHCLRCLRPAGLCICPDHPVHRHPAVTPADEARNNHEVWHATKGMETPLCRFCEEPWPCEVVRLRIKLAAVQAQLAAAPRLTDAPAADDEWRFVETLPSSRYTVQRSGDGWDVYAHGLMDAPAAGEPSYAPTAMDTECISNDLAADGGQDQRTTPTAEVDTAVVIHRHGCSAGGWPWTGCNDESGDSCLVVQLTDALDSARAERDDALADFTDMRDGVGRFEGEGYFAIKSQRDHALRDLADMTARYDDSMFAASKHNLRAAEAEAQREEMRANMNALGSAHIDRSAAAEQFRRLYQEAVGDLGRAESQRDRLAAELATATGRLDAVAAVVSGHEDGDGGTWRINPCDLRDALAGDGSADG